MRCHQHFTYSSYFDVKYTLMSQIIMITCLICCWSSTCQQNNSDPPRHGLYIWRIPLVSATMTLAADYKSCKLRGRATIDRTYCSSTFHRCSIGLRSGEFGGQGSTLNSSSRSSNRSGKKCAVWQRLLPLGSTVTTNGCTWSAIMSEHHTPWTGLPPSHSAPLCVVTHSSCNHHYKFLALVPQ